MPDKSFQPQALNDLAAEKVDQAYLRNMNYWEGDHDRMRKLYMMILGSPDPDKPEVKGRANLKTGISFLIHQLLYTTLKNALLNSENNMELEPSALRKIIFGKEEMEKYINDLFVDDQLPVAEVMRDGLWDLISHGTAVLRPYFENDIRTVWDGQQYFDMTAYQGPAFVNHAAWDTFPTAGCQEDKELHEVIFLESVYPHTLREWEDKGWVSGVDEFLKGHVDTVYNYAKGGKAEIKDPRRKKSDLYTDSTGRVDLLVYWGLFPLWKFEDYIGASGDDLSQDEVPTLIIKGRGKRKNILKIGPNFYYHQMIESIFARYFKIPGLFWGESIFGILHKMLVHQEDWNNLTQDAANANMFLDRAFPASVDQTQRNMKGVGRDYVISDDNFKNGLIPKFIDRGVSTLPDTYERLNYVDRVLQEVSGAMAFVRSMEGDVEKTATEIEELAQRINVRFEQTALDVQANLLQPVAAWCMSIMSQFSDDEYVMKNILGSSTEPFPINPFKQFSPMMPNAAYRIKMEGAIRAIRNMGMLNQFRALIDQGKSLLSIPAMPDKEGNIKIPDLMEMFFDEFKMAGFKDVEKYERTIPAATPVDGGVVNAPSA